MMPPGGPPGPYDPNQPPQGGAPPGYPQQQQGYPQQQPEYPPQQPGYPQQQQGYPQQQPGYPPQPGYPAQQPGYPQQPGFPQQQPGFGAPLAPAAGGQRNVALMAVGGVLLFIALVAGLVFLYNLYQYLTVADRWANTPGLSDVARRFGVRLIERAAMGRMMLFGPVAALFGAGGGAAMFLGLRKK